jgi:hypothetical protein
MLKIQEFGDLPGASPVPASLLESAKTLLSSTQESRNALRSIVTNFKDADLPILLRGSLYELQSLSPVLNRHW